MKKLYRKGAVHPTPPVVSDHLLSFLPAAILTLTVALSPEDREVLAYLISCSSANFSLNHRKATTQKSAAVPAASGVGAKSGADHPPCFNCSCFRCYMSYWVKWDLSPNRQLIHEIIDAFEDSLLKERKKAKNSKKKKGKTGKVTASLRVNEELKNSEQLTLTKDDSSSGESNSAAAAFTGGGGGDEAEEDDNMDYEEESEKGSVRKFVSFLGERIWSVWG